MKIDNAESSNNQVKSNIKHHSESKTNSNEKKIDIATKNLSKLSNYDKKELNISEKTIIETIEKANKAVLGTNTKFEFSIHEKTKQIMVKILNSETNEIIRELPSEKVLDMVANICEIAGVIVDKKG